MSIFTAWTESQWIIFFGLTVAGLSAIGLFVTISRIVRTWTAPATYRLAEVAPARPSLALAARRARYSEPNMDAVIRAAFESADLDATAHIAPGPGSITSILAEEGHYAPRVDLVDADLSVMFGDWYAAWKRSVDAALAPSMLKAIMWAIEGAEAGLNGAACLDDWRRDSPTGEFPALSLVSA